MSAQAPSHPCVDDQLKQLDQEYVAVCSQLGEAAVALEEAKARFDQFKARRLAVKEQYRITALSRPPVKEEPGE